MNDDRGFKNPIAFLMAAFLLMVGQAGRLAHSQAPARVAQIPGINPGPCNPGPEERPWLNLNQTPGCRALEVIASMTLEEKLAELGRITGRSANKRLGLTSGGGSDGPNGIASMGSGPPQARGRNVTAFANAVTLAATWDRELASQYGKALGEEFVGKGSNSILGPTINIMRTWHWGRNGETFSEDPYLTGEIAITEIKALYVFSVTGSGTAQLYVDHKLVTTMMRADFGQTVQGAINLKAGRPVPIELKYSNSSTIMGPGLAIGWQPPDPEMLAKAIAAAKQSDAAIVFAAEQMGEGQDKVTLALPGDQDNLINAVARANPRTIVVLHTSNPVSMPWLDKVAAVIDAFYPGQEAGGSIARVLFGDVNPSGKLAMTFPANEHQGPGSFFLDYPGDGMTVNFTEGVLVGYRWYDAKSQEPLFPFGYGLSYTTFRYSDLQVEHAGGEQATIRVRVTNAGTREGAEVVQLYLGSPAAAEEPPKQLKGFEKIRLKPGESKVVTMKLDKDSLAAWDTESHGWKVYPGMYSIMVGSSSRDIRLRGSLMIGSG